MTDTIKDLLLTDIRIDGDTQPRAELDQDLIIEYQAAYAAKADMPPVNVKFDGACYWLWDGFHRRWGAARAGMISLTCSVTTGTQEDAQWASYGANTTHGLRRTNADKAKAVQAALKHPGSKSNQQIAEHCRVDEGTVRKYRSLMESTSEIPKSESRTGSDGRTINTANIGKSTSLDTPAVQEALQSLPEAIAKDIASGKIAATGQEVKRFAKLDKGQAVDVARVLRKGQAKSVKEAFQQCGVAMKPTVKEQLEATLDEEPPEPEPDPTPEDIVKSHNQQIESFCQKVKKLADECPELFWLGDGDRRAFFLTKVKNGYETLRAGKCIVCPACNGEGCKHCKKQGYAPKQHLSSLGIV